MSITDLLKAEIEENGPVTVERFMALALSHPKQGYYMRRDPFGVAGDFTTAPEISQIFGELLGAWCAEAWRFYGSPQAALVELGPGRGTLMRDALLATARVSGFHDAISVHLVETSPRLAAIQRQTLANAHSQIHWHESIETLPKDKPLLILANEFFDALPIRQFIRTQEGMVERCISIDKKSPEAFCFTAGTRTHAIPPNYQAVLPGEVIERSFIAEDFIKDIAARLLKNQGFLLIADYGYEGFVGGETLQAVKAHRYHPVLENPGEADLTAHVNFTALKQTAEQVGLHVAGPVTQGMFLENLGARLRGEKLCSRATEAQKIAILSGLERLLSPQEMGTLFKVMAICSTPHPLPGF